MYLFSSIFRYIQPTTSIYVDSSNHLHSQSCRYRMLSTVDWVLSTVDWVLFTVDRVLFTVDRVLFTVMLDSNQLL